MKKGYFFLLSMTLIYSCQSSIQYDKLGKEMCQCLQPSLDLYLKQVELAEKEDIEGIKKLKEEQLKVVQDANVCLKQLELNQKDKTTIKEAEMIKEMEAQCPEVAEYWKKLD